MLYYVPRSGKPARPTKLTVDVRATPNAVRAMDSMGKSQRETLDILLGTFVCACTLAGHDDREELVDAEPVAGLMDIIVRAMCGGKRERVTLASDGISVTFELSADDETGLPFSIVRIEKNQPLVSTAGWSIE